MTEVNQTEIRMRVRRSHGGREAYVLQAHANTSVLDLLFVAQREQDRTLVFRSSCRIGVCGSCAMRINGREALACRTRALDAGTELRLEPLRHLPVVRDLAVDLAPFRAAYATALPALVPHAHVRAAETPHAPASGAAGADLGDCITCGACYSACDRAGSLPGYPGAAGFLRAAALLDDPRDAARDARAAAVAYWPECVAEPSCTDVCPKGLRHLPARRRLAGVQARPDG